MFETFARLGGLGGVRVAAEDFAKGRTVVAVALRGGVEVEDDAEPPVTVEPVVSANGKKRGAEGYDQPSALTTKGKKKGRTSHLVRPSRMYVGCGEASLGGFYQQPA